MVASSVSESVGSAEPTTFPRRMTVIRSATALISRSLWLIITTDRPLALSCRMISSSSSVSCGVSTAVGSSRMRIWASLTRALMISTRCCTPTGRSSTRASGSTSRLYFCDSSSTWLRAPSMSRNAPFVSSWPSITFSATVKTGTSMKCWWTMPIPASIASPGSWKWTSWPSMRILPSSGRYRPKRVFISVDFPAPFSPSRQWISPGSMTRSIESFAVKVPNRLVIPCSSSRTLLPPTPGVD